MQNIDELVKKYIALRDFLDNLNAVHTQKVNYIKSKMQQIEAAIAAKSLEDGVDSYRTSHGTAFFTYTDRCNIADWDSVLSFIKENDAYDLLTRAVKKEAVRGYIEKTGFVPPGLNWSTVRTFNCRKASERD